MLDVVSRDELLKFCAGETIPLSETMVSGNPCVANNPRSCSMVTCVVAECTTFASIHFEYASTPSRIILPSVGPA